MAVGNRVLAQSGDMGALPTLYAATQDIPGDTYIGPNGPGRCAATRGSRTGAPPHGTPTWRSASGSSQNG